MEPAVSLARNSITSAGLKPLGQARFGRGRAAWKGVLFMRNQPASTSPALAVVPIRWQKFRCLSAGVALRFGRGVLATLGA
jgi:hypothetical protein